MMTSKGPWCIKDLELEIEELQHGATVSTVVNAIEALKLLLIPYGRSELVSLHARLGGPYAKRPLMGHGLVPVIINDRERSHQTLMDTWGKMREDR